jgi:YHS domain-containing protein
MKKIIFILTVILVSTATVSCTSPALPVNVNSDGKAIKGFDTVAYFTEGKPVKGDEQFQFQWSGAKWLFSSRENLELFKAAPEKYAPKYGGY